MVVIFKIQLQEVKVEYFLIYTNHDRYKKSFTVTTQEELYHTGRAMPLGLNSLSRTNGLGDLQVMLINTKQDINSQFIKYIELLITNEKSL